MADRVPDEIARRRTQCPAPSAQSLGDTTSLPPDWPARINPGSSLLRSVGRRREGRPGRAQPVAKGDAVTLLFSCDTSSSAGNDPGIGDSDPRRARVASGTGWRHTAASTESRAAPRVRTTQSCVVAQRRNRCCALRPKWRYRVVQTPRVYSVSSLTWTW